MAYSSSFCAAKIREYQSVISQIGGLNGSIGTCGSYINGSDGTGGVNVHINKLKICGKTIDGGKLATISANVANILGILAPVVDECGQKIAFWQKLYLPPQILPR